MKPNEIVEAGVAYQALVSAMIDYSTKKEVFIAKYEKLIYERLIEICKFECVGRTEPTFACQRESFYFSIAKMSVENVDNRRYPCSRISFDFTNEGVQVIIEAISDHETDSAIVILVPIDQAAYESYLEQVKAAGRARLEAAAAAKALKEARTKRETEERERQTLARLIEKYGVPAAPAAPNDPPKTP